MIVLLLSTKWGQENAKLAAALGSVVDAALALAIISLLQDGV